MLRLCVRAEVDFAAVGEAPPVGAVAGVVAGVAGELVALADFAPPKKPNEDLPAPTLVALVSFAALASFFTGLGVTLAGWDFFAEVDLPEENPPENLGSSLANENTGNASRAIKKIFDVFMVI